MLGVGVSYVAPLPLTSPLAKLLNSATPAPAHLSLGQAAHWIALHKSVCRPPPCPGEALRAGGTGASGEPLPIWPLWQAFAATGGQALGGDSQPQPSPGEKVAAVSASSAASSKGVASESTDSEVEPASSAPSSVTTRAVSSAPGDPSNASPAFFPTEEEKKACACCLVVIVGKVFFCSHCHLVTYCGKDCQASGGF